MFAGRARGSAPAAARSSWSRMVRESGLSRRPFSPTNCAVMSSSMPGSSTTSTSSPASTTVSALGTKPEPPRSTEITSAPVGQPDVGDRAARRGRVVGDHELDDLEPLLGQVEQVDEPVARHLVLDQAQDQVGRGHRRLDAEQLEVVEVPRVVDAGDDPLAEVLLLGDLADQQVVLVVAGDRHDEVGALDARRARAPTARSRRRTGRRARAPARRSGSGGGPARRR